MSTTVLSTISESKVRFIHLQFTDLLGMPKSVAVPAEVMPRVFSEGLRFDGSSVDAFVRRQETDMYLHPDPNTFVVLPWSDPLGPTARMICEVRDLEHTPYAGCPRHRLALIERELSGLGIEVRASAELEFYLLARDDNGFPTTSTRDRVGYFDLAPASPGDETRRAVVLYLQDMGIPVEASHHESSPGQHGIDIGWGGLLETADRLLTVKSVIKRAAIMHDLHATFMPRPADSLTPSMLHLNLQITRDGQNLLKYSVTTHKPSDVSSLIIEGILSHVAEFTLVTNPLVNSYKKGTPQLEWGDSGNVAVRVAPVRGAKPHLELRTADPSCNVYLALTCATSAVLAGFKPHTKSSHPFPALPRDLGQAITEFEQSRFCLEALGEVLFHNFLTAKKLEWTIFGSAVHAWEVKQYLDKY